MTPPGIAPARRTLVLGGGGAVGVGWQVGILTGLREAGVDLTGASETLGTSAGALVGALLSSGHDVSAALIALGALEQSINPATLAAGNDAFLSAMRQASLGTNTHQLVRAIGRAALDAGTVAQDAYLGLFEVLEGSAWPAGFHCNRHRRGDRRAESVGRGCRCPAVGGCRLELRRARALPPRHHRRPPLHRWRNHQPPQRHVGVAE